MPEARRGDLVWQDSLFSPAEERPVTPGPLRVDGLRRHRLDERSWLDLAPRWLPDHAELFDLLVADAPWAHRERWMYDKKVLEPRLVATWSAETLQDLPPRLEEIRSLMSRHYRVEFDSVLLNLYRDGQDGVAWHGDTVRKRLDEAVVVTIGLGERRRFLLRPGTSGPPTLTLESGYGDLVVMGGRTQHEWQHTVPKAARAGARISITMRHSQPLPGRAPSG